MRTVAGVVVGYLVMTIVVFASFMGLYAVLGPERSFLPERYDPSPVWITASILLGFLAAMLGGYVAYAVGRTVTAPRALAGFVLILGLVLAIPSLRPAAEDPRPDVRVGDVPALQAMSNARMPAWLALLNPVLGFAGALYGGRKASGGS